MQGNYWYIGYLPLENMCNEEQFSNAADSGPSKGSTLNILNQYGGSWKEFL